MARDEFLSNLRSAASCVDPAYQPNGIRLEGRHVYNLLYRGDMWLTSKAVEGYDATDFPELSSKEVERLNRSVERFRAVASEVPEDGPATEAQVRDALPEFLSIFQAMQPHLEGFNIYRTLKNIQNLPDFVRDFAVSIGDDWSGDPAVHIWIIVSDEVAGPGLASRLVGARRDIERCLRNAKIERNPYIMVRTESEQRQLEEGADAPA